VRIVEREDDTAVVSPDRDLADDRQPVGVGVERVAEQIVDAARAGVPGIQLHMRESDKSTSVLT
jgi:hypothetical protein